MIKVENVVFEYPQKRALNNVSFHIKQGSITALVGPNGSGKTTLMRCIAALDTPFSGNIFVSDVDALENPREAHRKIGYLSDFFGLYNDLTIKQCLTFVAELHQIPQDFIPEKIAIVTEQLDLSSRLNVTAGNLSRGLRQRLGIAQAIIHDPQILILDEPASGLDPEARYGLSRLFLDLNAKGVTLLVSSHILAELEDYCTDMLMIRNGEIIDHLQAGKKSSSNENESKVTIKVTLCENADKYLTLFKQSQEIEAISVKENVIEFLFPESPEKQNLLLKMLIENNVPLYNFTTHKKSLQDIYMDYATEKGI
ncbi:MAG: ABC transporter ATP-binding protein [Pseudomonadota bacterium]